MPLSSATPLDVRDFGAVGNGVALDSPAIQRALDAAGSGRTVILPAGQYLCFTLHLRSGVTLEFASGAVLLAASPSPALGSYDPPEPNPWGDEHQYQDFGHSHWHNSLLVGENLTDICIQGPGLIDGAGLLREADYPSSDENPGPNNTTPAGARTGRPHGHSPPGPDLPGHGNKAIALKNCQRVTLRDFTLFRGGHFALLATGVDDLTVSDLTIDTNRDGLDIDGCSHVSISGCTINTPMDDAIVLKASYALGEVRSCEHVEIHHCRVSGFDVGTLLDGTFGRSQSCAPDQDGPTGRIKIGTESNGSFRHITIADCSFQRSRGLALETVDGGTIEDVIVSNLTMDEVTNAPVFLRLGNRARGPAGTPIGRLRRITIRDISATRVDGRFPVIMAGLPDQPIEDVTLTNVKIDSAGGIRLTDVAAQSHQHVNPFFLGGDEPGVTGPRATTAAAVPRRESAYPEPSMFGLLPASAFFLRSIRGLTLENVNLTLQFPDERPPIICDDVTDLRIIAGNLSLDHE